MSDNPMSILLNYGFAGVILYVFMLRIEKKLDALTDAVLKLAQAM